MKKGIAIRTILLLLIGVLAAGIIIFVIYKYASSSIISEAECHVRLSEICMTCKNAGWSGWSGANFFNVTEDCASYSTFSGFSGSNDCGDIEDPCKMFGIE